ncbi:transmembrane protein, putative (macronuclear) [Tetrahymena thermophila SB210]|uniref:Transmembrane protein, putative n=1 Tax=Tetrahymena thermophila (strain SB210) TaxID=312017 RepID=W7XGI3_TETTS|nr:transmembrane protein, putative [Tetrahymena thermophila SB210]EWS73256.1 transmembrane protein, putative [Tetrahymena thermophila SB210]|eukprot:XP_012654220.1 transmembrane protein, putative [Tetrahymena thermophila SB210]
MRFSSYLQGENQADFKLQKQLLCQECKKNWKRRKEENQTKFFNFYHLIKLQIDRYLYLLNKITQLRVLTFFQIISARKRNFSFFQLMFSKITDTQCQILFTLTQIIQIVLNFVFKYIFAYFKAFLCKRSKIHIFANDLKIFQVQQKNCAQSSYEMIIQNFGSQQCKLHKNLTYSAQNNFDKYLTVVGQHIQIFNTQNIIKQENQIQMGQILL